MEHIKTIASQFALDSAVAEVRPLNIGFINDSYVVASASGRRYLLQRINTAIFRDVDMLQSNISLVTDRLRRWQADHGCADVDAHVLRLVPAKADSKLYVTDAKGNAWRVYHFIEGTHSVDEVNAHTAYLAGKAFGEFQNALADIPAESLGETIPNFHNMVFRIGEFEQAVADNKDGRVGLPESQSIIAEIRSRAEQMSEPQRLCANGLMPKRINHCDTKVNNMLLDAEGTPVAIVDLDTVMPSLVLSDFGDFMRTGANTGREDADDLDTVDVNLEVFEAFTRGYLEAAQFLTEREREWLPFAAKWMTYMQTVRFFTDYLNGDTYYKTQYPEHNLQRTRAQLRLLEQQEARYDQLVHIVNKYSQK